MRAAITCAGSNPGEIDRNAAKLRTRRSDPTTSITASAISPPTSHADARACDFEAVARRPSIDPEARAAAEVARTAGTMLNMTAVATPTTSANARAVPFTTISSARGRPVGTPTTSACTVSTASATPAAAPMTASSNPSVTSCRINRARPPPNAARTASSRSRAVARASSRFATLTHAMRSTRSVAPNSIQRSGALAPTTSALSGVTVASRRYSGPGSQIGFAERSDGHTARTSRRAWSSVALGASRPMNSLPPTPHMRPVFFVSITYGRQYWTPAFGYRKDGGITPMIVNGRPWSRTVRPMTSRAPPNSRRQVA